MIIGKELLCRYEAGLTLESIFCVHKRIQLRLQLALVKVGRQSLVPGATNPGLVEGIGKLQNRHIAILAVANPVLGLQIHKDPQHNALTLDSSLALQSTARLELML